MFTRRGLLAGAYQSLDPRFENLIVSECAIEEFGARFRRKCERIFDGSPHLRPV